MTGPNPDCAARDRQHLPHVLLPPGGNKPGSVCGGVPHDCGHYTSTPGCGGCDPAAVEFVRDDGDCTWRRVPDPVYARLIPSLDQATVHRTLVLDLLQDHRRVQNVRSCSARGCAWHPSPVGRNGDPDAMRTRHHQYNQHLADLIVAALQPPGVLAPADLDSGHASGPHAVTPPGPTEVT